MADEVKGPTVEVELAWAGDLRFQGRAGAVELALDGDARAAASPVQALAAALAGCMATDVVHILLKGRLPLKGLTCRLKGERAAQDPRRLLRVQIHFAVEGDVPPDKVERAIALSRETYCSVWHSLRPDIDLSISHAPKG